MGSSPVSLSIIWSIQQNCEAFFWSFIEKHQKNPFSRRFLAQNVIFYWLKLPFLLLAHLLQPNGQLSCKFEYHRINTAKLRSVFLEFHRKTPKNPFFRHFLAQNVIFFLIRVAFFIIGTPFATKRAAILKVWASSDDYSKIVKRFSGVSLKNPQKNRFFDDFWPKT